MPFDPANPPPQDLTSLAWATWVFYDRTGATNLTEAQVLSRLGLHTRTVGGVVYQRPLAAAADYITSPDRLVERQRNEIGERFVDPLKVAAEWRALQADLDAGIPAVPDDPGAPGQVDLSIDWGGW